MPWNRIICPFRYEGPVAHLVHRTKFRRDVGAATALGEALVRAAVEGAARGGNAPGWGDGGRAGTERVGPPGLVIPVPLHLRRLWSRGFNQAEEIGRALARALELPLDPGAVRRIRHTPAQSGLDGRRLRERNVAGAFQATPRFRRMAANGGWERLVVVDDVLTTGATAAAMVRALRAALPSSRGYGEAGPGGWQPRIELWVCARA